MATSSPEDYANMEVIKKCSSSNGSKCKSIPHVYIPFLTAEKVVKKLVSLFVSNVWGVIFRLTIGVLKSLVALSDR